MLEDVINYESVIYYLLIIYQLLLEMVLPVSAHAGLRLLHYLAAAAAAAAA